MRAQWVEQRRGLDERQPDALRPRRAWSPRRWSTSPSARSSTPELVRERGRARPHDHPRQRQPPELEPMGIGIASLLQGQREHRQQRGRRATSRSELEKLASALKYGADTVMDLSTGGDIDGIREAIIARSPGADRHRADLPGARRA